MRHFGSIKRCQFGIILFFALVSLIRPWRRSQDRAAPRHARRTLLSHPLDCPIHDITLRDITDIRDFKLYDQPNLEVGRDKDASAGIGTLKHITFEKLTFNRPGSIQVHANTDGLTIRDVKLHFAPSANYRLVELGPKSVTYKHKPSDPATWVEILSPDLDCAVRNLTISGVRLRGGAD